MLYPTVYFTLFAFTADAMSLHSFAFKPISFSQRICFPAFAAFMGFAEYCQKDIVENKYDQFLQGAELRAKTERKGMWTKILKGEI